jgi:hypothetical protein
MRAGREAEMDKLPPSTPPRKEKRAEYVDNLPDHLSLFGRAIWKERDTCRKFLVDAMEEYDDKIYDTVIDATNKDVLAAMKSGREAILTHADSILSIACDCAGDNVPAITAGSVLAEAEADDPRNLGELIGCTLSDMRSLGQDMACKALAGSLSPDAREALLDALMP